MCTYITSTTPSNCVYVYHKHDTIKLCIRILQARHHQTVCTYITGTLTPPNGVYVYYRHIDTTKLCVRILQAHWHHQTVCTYIAGTLTPLTVCTYITGTLTPPNCAYVYYKHDTIKLCIRILQARHHHTVHMYITGTLTPSNCVYVYCRHIGTTKLCIRILQAHWHHQIVCTYITGTLTPSKCAYVYYRHDTIKLYVRILQARHHRSVFTYIIVYDRVTTIQRLHHVLCTCFWEFDVSVVRPICLLLGGSMIWLFLKLYRKRQQGSMAAQRVYR